MQALKGFAHVRSPPLKRRAPALHTSVRTLHVLPSAHSLGSRTTFLNTRRTSDTVAILYRQRRETRAYGWWWWGSSAPTINTPPPPIPASSDYALEAPPPQSNPQPTVEATSIATDSSASIPLPPEAGWQGSLDAAQSDVLEVIANGDHIGDLASLGLARWTPSGLVQTLLEQLHVNVGLSWWAAIVVCSLATRFLLFPVLLKVQVNNLRLAAIRPQMELHMGELKAAKDAGDMQTAQKASIRAQKLLRDHDCHPLKSLIGPLVQLPLALAFFSAIRGMCKLPVESMASGGALWFTDLTAGDPYYILPMASSAAMMMMINASQKDNPQTPITGHVNNFFRILAVVSVPFMGYLPSGLLLYFAANGAFLLLQALAFRTPAVRVWATLPPISQVTNPKAPTIRESINAYIKYARDQRDKAMQEARQKSSFGVPVTTTLSALEKGSQGSAGRKSSKPSGKAKTQGS